MNVPLLIMAFLSQVVLFDIGSGYQLVNEWKTDLWNATHIGIPSHDKESSDAVVFGAMVAWFLGEVGCKKLYVGNPFISPQSLNL